MSSGITIALLLLAGISATVSNKTPTYESIANFALNLGALEICSGVACWLGVVGADWTTQVSPSVVRNCATELAQCTIDEIILMIYGVRAGRMDILDLVTKCTGLYVPCHHNALISLGDSVSRASCPTWLVCMIYLISLFEVEFKS
jgi:hypothetical protein